MDFTEEQGFFYESEEMCFSIKTGKYSIELT